MWNRGADFHMSVFRRLRGAGWTRTVEDEEMPRNPFLRGLEQPNGMPFQFGRWLMERDEPIDLGGTELI
jgi:hypothetical protein